MARSRTLRPSESRPQSQDGSRSNLHRRRSALRKELAQLRPGGWQRVRPPEPRSQAGARASEKGSLPKETTPKSAPSEGPAHKLPEAPVLPPRVPPAGPPARVPPAPPGRPPSARPSKALVWTVAGLSSALAIGLAVLFVREPKGATARRPRPTSTAHPPSAQPTKET